MVVACLGCCSLAPAMMIDDQTYGRLTPQKIRKLIRQYRRDAEKTEDGHSVREGVAILS